MNIIARRSGGRNIIARPQALPDWQPEASVNPVEVEIHYRELNADGSFAGVPILVGRFAPGAEIRLPYTPLSDKKLTVYKNEISADGTRRYSSLKDAEVAGLLIDRSMVAPALDSVDEHVPLVTVAPTVTKSDNSDDWIIFFPKPDDYGYTLTAAEVRVVRASDDFEVTKRSGWLEQTLRIPQPAFDCQISYRWQNNSIEDAGDGRGWSAWSPETLAAGLGSATPIQPEADVTEFDADPNDVHNPVTRKTTYDETF